MTPVRANDPVDERQTAGRPRWMTWSVIGGGLVAVSVLIACSHSKAAKLGFDPHGDPGVSDAQVTRILNAAQVIEANVSQADLAAQGKTLFESAVISNHGEACAGCHTSGGGVNPALGTIQHPTKPGDFTGPRDPIQLWGAAHTAPYTWGGGVATLEKQVTNTILNFFKNGKTQSADATAQQTAQIVAYIKTLEPPQSDYDRGTLSPAARRGQALFEGKAGCAQCHSGPYFTDNRNHDIGVPKTAGETDPGNPAIPGAFNTPSLRDVKNTAPYMHNGVFATLDDVLHFYNGNKAAGTPSLGGPERADLIAYLESL